MNEKEQMEYLKKENSPKFRGVIIAEVFMTLMFVGFVFFYLLPTLRGLTGNNQKSKTPEIEEYTPNYNEKYTTAISTNNKIYLLDENLEDIWTYSIDKSISGLKMYDNNIYFLYEGKIKKINITTKEEEEKNISSMFSEYWDLIGVNKNTIIVGKKVDIYQINNINNNTYDESKDYKKLKLESGNKETFINDIIYYTDESSNNIIAYNIKNKKKETIDKKGRIVKIDNNGFIYVNSANKYIMYNGITKEKTYIMEGNQYALSSGPTFPMDLYKDKVYIVKDNTLYIALYNEFTELYKFSLNSDEQIQGLIVLNKNKVLLLKYINNGSPCQNDVCGPTGEYKNIILDLKTKEIKELNNQDVIYCDSFRTQHLY